MSTNSNGVSEMEGAKFQVNESGAVLNRPQHKRKPAPFTVAIIDNTIAAQVSLC